MFRAAYEQAGNTVALWVGTDVDRMIGGGWEIPMTWFLSLNPLIVFLLTPVVVAHWTRRAARGRDHTPLTKMAIGALVVALSYLLLAGVSAQGGSNAAWPWAVCARPPKAKAATNRLLSRMMNPNSLQCAAATAAEELTVDFSLSRRSIVDVNSSLSCV